VFFRDDDVGEWTAPLRHVVSLFLELRLPVNYQVIPAKLDDTCARELRGLSTAQPALVHLNQHGYRHEQLIRSRHRWSEFAGGRPQHEQEADIVAGAMRLREMLGGAGDTAIFTPPQHKYDLNTLRALENQKVEIISSSFYPSLVPQLAYRAGSLGRRTTVFGHAISQHGRVRDDANLLELSISVALDDARSATGDLTHYLTQYRNARRRTTIVGVMLHHSVMGKPEQLAVLREFVLRLQATGDVQFLDLRTIRDRVLGSQVDTQDSHRATTVC
jgi:hypothetical protein